MTRQKKLSTHARLTHPILHWRIDKNLTIRDAIKLSEMQVTRQAWRAWETGAMPTDLHIGVLAKILGTDLATLADELETWNRKHAPKNKAIHAARNMWEV